MSKRISNKRKGRKTWARSRVKYGWKTQALFARFGMKQVLDGTYRKMIND